jgi:NAD(P)-dependent dehydrogenase (short-subunit alcohol dehydrogenase family)
MSREILRDRVAIITCAGQGLGRSVAREFADEGCAVALVDINPQTLGEAEAELRGKGQTVMCHALDITDYKAYGEAIDEVAKKWGHIDILVNNAAIAFYGTILDDSLEHWRRQIAVNLEAIYMGTKMVAPHMVRQKFGRIINITSVQGFMASGQCGAYNAAKGGIIVFTKSLAVELAPYNIAVNAVAPGFIRTPMAIVNGVHESEMPDFKEWYVAKRHIPMARTGYPEDVSGAVVFLASDYCRYITGALLVVDGGLSSTF